MQKLVFLLLHRGKNNVNPIEATQKAWKNVWYNLFYWIKFNSKIDKVFINVYKGKKCHIIFATLREEWGLDLDKMYCIWIIWNYNNGWAKDMSYNYVETKGKTLSSF